MNNLYYHSKAKELRVGRRSYSFCLFIIVLVSIWFPSLTRAQLHSITIFGSFTTSSKLFYNPKSPDEYYRQQHFALDQILGAGIDIRRNIEEIGLQVGINVEYIKKTRSISVPKSNKDVEIEDGYMAIPIELSGYFVIPFSSETFRLYLGGGGGLYLGDRIYIEAGIRARTIEKKAGYGIHILSGLLYKFHDNIGLQTELKFRDIQFEIVNAFEERNVISEKVIDTFDDLPFVSRISIDGMVLKVGLAFLI